MNLQDFFNFKNNCIICSSLLSKEAQVDVYISNSEIPNYNIAVAGSIIYKYVNNKFYKSYIDVPYNPKVLDPVFKHISNTFTMNKIFNPKFKTKQLSDIIEPYEIFSFETRILRLCNNNHLFYYESEEILQNDICSDINIDCEIVSKNRYTVCNNYKNNIGYETEFQYPYEKVIKTEKFPFIPISKWNFKNLKQLKIQAEKYILLK